MDDAAAVLGARTGWVATARQGEQAGALACEILLAIPPVTAVDPAWDLDRALRAIVLDPAFQVK